MNHSYIVEFQPRLVEEAVLRAIAGHREESLFRKERDQLYECRDNDGREVAFQQLHQSWFNRLGLGNPLRQVFELWPILTTSTHRCLLIKGRSKKDIGAELYLAPHECDVSEHERRIIVIQLTPELLCQSQQLLDFLRHELLHIVDMLDPSFGYEPDFPKTFVGPAYDHFLQARYGVFWDITIDGRLYQNGWLPSSVREKHWTIFKHAFSGSEEKLEKTFSYFFDEGQHTHRELMAYAQHPEKWLSGTTAENSAKGRCALCHFPTFHLINSNDLRVDLIAKIQAHYPAWNSQQPICQQCTDLYEACT